MPSIVLYLQSFWRTFYLQRQNQLDLEWEEDRILINEASGAADELKIDRGIPVKCLRRTRAFSSKMLTQLMA